MTTSSLLPVVEQHNAARSFLSDFRRRHGATRCGCPRVIAERDGRLVCAHCGAPVLPISEAA